MRAGKLGILLSVLALFGGCAETPEPRPVYTYYVPTTGMIQRKGLGVNPANVLVMNDEAAWIGRDEKWIEGAVQEGGISAYTIYTWDAQRISDNQGSSGYRYRWMVQQGASSP